MSTNSDSKNNDYSQNSPKGRDGKSLPSGDDAPTRLIPNQPTQADSNTSVQSDLTAVNLATSLQPTEIRDSSDSGTVVDLDHFRFCNEDRYCLDGELARGGMGVIFKGQDKDIGRTLAFKVLLSDHRNDAAIIRRFIEEAKIGGQLQHPGIVPVYDVGRFADSRPFFTMKLVKGKTLAEMLRARQDHSSDLPRLLNIFRQVCEAMAYAHSRHVIHRDLKPANVMVGAFGEVQLMDWGLAKILTDVAPKIDEPSDTSDASVISTAHLMDEADGSNSDSHTRMGSVLGTPAYMSPEQARGEIDLLDERTDVFGLGAILCEILTGAPAYVANNNSAVFRKAARGQLDEAFLRLDSERIDRELADLTKQCLAKEISDRLPNADEVRRRITDYQNSVEERARNAEVDTAKAQLRALEERKRRRITLAAALIGCASLAIACVAWVVVRENQAKFTKYQASQQMERQMKVSGLLSNVTSALKNFSPSLNATDDRQLKLLEDSRKELDEADRLINLGIGDRPLMYDPAGLRGKVNQTIADASLLKDLEKIWDRQGESDTDNSRVRATDQTEFSYSLSKAYASDSTQGSIGVPLIQVIDKYRNAFGKWGLSPDHNSIDTAASKILAIDPFYLPSVIVSLDQWFRLDIAPLSYLAWDSSTWFALKPIQLVSRGGDSLTTLEDGSILASGPHPEAGYDLIFETDVQAIRGFRLDGLLDASLPDKGPGRGQGGQFFISDIKIQVQPRDASGEKQSVTIRSAIANYSWDISPISADSWHNADGAGYANTAFFEADQTLLCDKGFRIYISHSDSKNNDPWRDQNLGRFKWSVSGAQKNTAETIWLRDLVAKIDNDAWRKEMRKEVEDKNVVGLIARANNFEVASKQPTLVNIELAKALNAIDDKQIWTSSLSNAQWTALRPDSVKSNVDGVDVAIQDDNSVFLTNQTPQYETVDFHAPYSEPKLSAVLLELIPDERTPNHGIGRGPFGHVMIRDIKFQLSGPGQSAEAKPLSVKQILIPNDGTASLNANAFVDDIRNGVKYTVPWIDKSHQYLFYFEETEVPADWALQVSISTMSSRHLGRFKVSTLRGATSLINPKETARNLLNKMFALDPSNYRINEELCNAYLSDLKIDYQQASAFATSLLALRPDDPLAHFHRLRTLPLKQMIADPAQRDIITLHLRNILASQDSWVIYVATKAIYEHADNAFRAKQTDAFNVYLDLLTLVTRKSFPNHLALAFNCIHFWNQPKRGVEIVRELLKDDLSDEQKRQVALALNNCAWENAQNGNTQDFSPSQNIELAEQAVQLSPNDLGLVHTLGVVYLRADQNERAAETLQRCWNSGDESLKTATLPYLIELEIKQGNLDKARGLLKDADAQLQKFNDSDAAALIQKHRETLEQ